MNYQLTKLDPADTGKAQWLSMTPGQAPEAVSHGQLEDALHDCGHQPMVLIIPGEQALMTTVELPIRQASKLLKAVPYALEESLAADVDDLHFALGHREGDKSEVVAVDIALMNDWTVELGELGVTPKMIIPDVLALPWHEEEWSILIDDARAMVRTGHASGFVTETVNLSAMIEAQLSNGIAPTIVRLWNCSGEKTALQWPAASTADAPPIKQYDCRGGALAVLAQGWDPRKSLNLLQGSYHQQADALKLLKPWRLAAALVGVWLIVGFGHNWLQQSQLKAQQAALKTQAEKIYRSTFPQAKRIVNPRVQMEQKLKALKGGSTTAENNFLQLLALSSRVINQQSKIKLDKVGYKNGELSLDVVGPSLSQLDSLKQKLAATSGLTAELKSADSGANQATGSIKIRQKL